MSKVLLEGRWDETKEALLEGLKGTRRSTMGVILENTKKQLLAESTAGTTTAGNIATLNRVILPVIRRVMPTVIANELVGVQPMTGPVGQIHTLRVRYANNLTDNSAAQTSVTAGEVDVICARDSTLLVLEVKSTYLRRSQQDAWQHETTTLRKAGQQIRRKLLAVQQALLDQPALAQQLGMPSGAMDTAFHGWIVDTSIECDHQRFGGFLKVSLEELLIALRDDRHLLHDPDGMFTSIAAAGQAAPQSLYPQGFSAARLIEVVEAQAVWQGV